eukprot:Gregarina_sp_Poly_1__9139@NODE_560_length_7529_cov_61_005092_g406_i1_p2_GENE_NODE_560_length_7529_cov_61_005092_g406_i1NODE_560_length_7529_cov_61_005092_g406_i1_p2_ORF_typecomplete_len478_score44_25_NODE_560_length_7529_cov_61_005092_g406_i112362669
MTESDTASVKSDPKGFPMGEAVNAAALAARRDVIIQELHAHWDSPIAMRFARADADHIYALPGDDKLSRSRLPVRGLTPGKVIRKIWHCATAGGRHTIAEKLDTCLMLTYWRQLRLGISPIVYWTTRPLIIGIFAKSTTGFRTDWDITSSEPFIAYIISLVSAAVLFLQNVGCSGIIDVIFVCLLWFVRNISFFYTLWIVRDTHFFDITQPLSYIGINLPESVDWETLCIWGFVIHPAASLLHGLFYVQSAFLSRKYTHYVMQPRSRAARRLASPQDGKEERFVRGDEFGWISTSSVLVFLNAKHHLAPIGLHELLVGPDMIKAVRLCDVLLTHDWYCLGLVCAVKALSFLLVHDYRILGVFLVHVILEILYIMLSQTVRLMTLRRFETKSLYLDMIQAWYNQDLSVRLGRQQPDESSVEDSSATDQTSNLHKIAHVFENTRRFKQERLVEMANVLDRYRRQAFLTSPGETLPLLRT